MTSKTCPKCGTKGPDATACSRCGLNFANYARAKLEKLGEVHGLLSESKFHEAKQLAEKLPALFPDNKTDFVLLLSNINRDISIVDKYEQAQKAFAEGDYAQVSLLLRNIKAFDSALNERVVGLRRRAETVIQDNALFQQGVAAFNRGDYPAARGLFRQFQGTAAHREEIADYLRKINAETRGALKQAVDCISTGQFALAEAKLARLQAARPDLLEEIAAYQDLLTKRLAIKEQIARAADKARAEQKLLEAKVLYGYLALQFPESLPEIQPRLQEIGARAVINLADLQASGAVDLAALGVETTGAGAGLTLAASDLDADIPRDLPAAEIPALEPVAGSHPATADEFSPPVELDFAEIPDFIF